jgi:hypothetical protein
MKSEYFLITPTNTIRFQIIPAEFDIKDIIYEDFMKALDSPDYTYGNILITGLGRLPYKSVISQFFNIFISPEFKGYTFIAHYGKGFDFQPVLGEMLENKLKPEKITSGNKITYLKVKGLNIGFVDSINFTMCALKHFQKHFA